MKKLSITKFCSLLFGICLFACEQRASSASKNEITVAFEKEIIKSDSSYIAFPWLPKYDVNNNIQNTIPLPKGFYRETMSPNSFAYWLRHLPLKVDDNVVNLYNGEQKRIQSSQFAILNIDVGTDNLQQCADAVMRLRAEYLFSQKRFDDIHFNYTSGDKASWGQWRKGMRPIINGNTVVWKSTASSSDAYDNFKKYLWNVFTYCGSLSLSRELLPIADIHDIKAGDVFIRGGTPGHAEIVLDVAINRSTGKKIFLLAQSYMPAQEIQLLKNPNNENLSPWYEEDFGEDLITPEFPFKKNELMKFQ